LHNFDIFKPLFQQTVKSLPSTVGLKISNYVKKLINLFCLDRFLNLAGDYEKKNLSLSFHFLFLFFAWRIIFKSR